MTPISLEHLGTHKAMFVVLALGERLGSVGLHADLRVLAVRSRPLPLILYPLAHHDDLADVADDACEYRGKSRVRERPRVRS